MMTPERFASLAEAGYNRIPVTRELLADLDTPLSTYMKLADAPWSFLLESVQGDEKWGRYSWIGLPCHERIEVRGHVVRRFKDGYPAGATEVADPLEWIEQFRLRFKVPEEPDNRLNGGLVGYFGYDTVRYIEPRLAGIEKPDPLEIPDILLLVANDLVVFDSFSNTLKLLTYVDPSEENAYGRAQEYLSSLEHQLREQVLTPERTKAEVVNEPTTEDDFFSSFSQQDYEAAVERIKEYIRAGDLMQCVPSQRMSTSCKVSPLVLYRALRNISPSPYMFYFNFEDHHVVGASPEILARVENGQVTVRPIAGTIKRGHNAEEDLVQADALINDPKERAEHVMLIDLGRNDVGRISEDGSVAVTDTMVIERYSHVMHITSNVVGTLRKGLGPMDVLRATFPAGTLSGAPKIRALEIIDELEPVKRGIYSGAIGYLAWQGNMDMAIGIRTAVIKDGNLHLQAGAGIVADSIPEKEWEETLNKRAAMFKAIELAERGLNI